MWFHHHCIPGLGPKNYYSSDYKGKNWNDGANTFEISNHGCNQKTPFTN